MNFGQAIEAMKKSRCVSRSGWNGKSMHLYLEDMLSFKIGDGVFKGEKRKYQPFLVLFNAQGQHQPGWVPSQSDMLAEDWDEVYPE